ncbi:family 16 glycoside hydrolase [Mariniblastus fucicola]|uniref:Carbohydrate binding domain protein n=1 Tax=Mariniblastus fucicola TaxID=980251 RepID=A0A5B9PE83_9BACT|nr:family 16 glycoside hydrolase [Mariniblastus fucicola]QEG25017.1 Carbohydrate binding domain protein [Mariniblastus fucicola]
MKLLRLAFVFLTLFSTACASAQTDGYESLFNGKDLTGWSYLPTTEAQKKGRAGWKKADPNAPAWPIVETKVNFDGKLKSDDGRFVAQDSILVVTVPPESRKVQMLYSDAVVKGDFELRLEFRAANNADSGVFIRGHQLQCRDYPNTGPYKDLKKFKPNDWNELIVVVSGETARCTCNGEVLEEKFKVPAEGPIGVEGDRGKMEYRNIRIKRSSENLLKPTNEVDAWTFEQFEKGKGSISADGESIVFDVTHAGGANWHVQTYQTGLDLEDGAEYKVSFEIKADNDDAMVGVQASINEDDWHSIGFYKEIYPANKFETYEFTFWASDVVRNKNRIGFVIGAQAAKITVRNFSLVRVSQ